MSVLQKHAIYSAIRDKGDGEFMTKAEVEELIAIRTADLYRAIPNIPRTESPKLSRQASRCSQLEHMPQGSRPEDPAPSVDEPLGC